MDAFCAFDSYGSTQNDMGGFHIVRGERGPYELTIRLPNVAFGKRYEFLFARAVVDDFGDLVLVCDENGRVTLQ